MRNSHKTIGYLILIAFLSCLLMGCPSPRDESKQAEEHVKQALSMAEESLGKFYPNAKIMADTFYGVSGVHVGPDHLMTDWVEGEYQDGGKEYIMINVVTKDIYVSSEWDKINSYGMKAVRDLYRLDNTKMDGSVSGYKEEPYCSDDPDKYGNLKIENKLPLGTVADDNFAGELLKNEKYNFVYELSVNEDVDKKIFEKTDYSSLGRNVRVLVKQYDNEYFKNKDIPRRNADTETHEPIAVFDSGTN